MARPSGSAAASMACSAPASPSRASLNSAATVRVGAGQRAGPPAPAGCSHRGRSRCSPASRSGRAARTGPGRCARSRRRGRRDRAPATPPMMIPAPTPIRPIRKTTSSQSRALPRWCSARTARSASLPTYDRDVGREGLAEHGAELDAAPPEVGCDADPAGGAGRPCRGRSPRPRTPGRSVPVVSRSRGIASATSATSWLGTARARSGRHQLAGGDHPAEPDRRHRHVGHVDVHARRRRARARAARPGGRVARPAAPPLGTTSSTRPSCARSPTRAPTVDRLRWSRWVSSARVSAPSRCTWLSTSDRLCCLISSGRTADARRPGTVPLRTWLPAGGRSRRPQQRAAAPHR